MHTNESNVSVGKKLNTKMGLEKMGLKVLFKLTFNLGFSDIRW